MVTLMGLTARGSFPVHTPALTAARRREREGVRSQTSNCRGGAKPSKLSRRAGNRANRPSGGTNPQKTVALSAHEAQRPLLTRLLLDCLH